jgi:hypothetical protein
MARKKRIGDAIKAGDAGTLKELLKDGKEKKIKIDSEVF